MNDEEARVLAEKHWDYNQELLKVSDAKYDCLHHFLFVQAFIHGVKHEREK